MLLPVVRLLLLLLRRLILLLFLILGFVVRGLWCHLLLPLNGPRNRNQRSGWRRRRRRRLR